MSLKIYKTQLTPAKNALLDNIEDYLSMIESNNEWYTGEDSLSYVSEDFQYVKPDIDIKIKINLPLNNNNLFDSIGNYIRIEQRQTDNTGATPVQGEISIWYYFIIASRWIAQGTLELTCSMDTVNTFHDFINDRDNWHEKTNIFREHEKNTEITVNNGYLNYSKIIDRYSEDFEPSVLLKKNDEIIEEPNSVGVKEWYLVYETDAAATDVDASVNSMKCYLYPSETFVYQREAGSGSQAFTRTVSDFIDKRRYGIVNGKVSFSGIKIGMKYSSYANDGFYLSYDVDAQNYIFRGLKNVTLSGYAQVGDKVKTKDNVEYTCESVIWYKNSDRSGNSGYMNIPMGVFRNDNTVFLATYLTSYNGIDLFPGYYIWMRNANFAFGWHLFYGLLKVSGAENTDITDGGRIVQQSGSIYFNRLKNVSNTTDNLFSGYDYNWGRNSIHNTSNYTLSFDKNVSNIFMIDYSKDIPAVTDLASGNSVYTNGTGSKQYTIQPLTELNRTDPKLVKILALPYCPTDIKINGSISSGTWSYSFDNDIIDIQNVADNKYRLYYKNTNQSFGKELNNSVIDLRYTTDSEEYFNSGTLQLKNIDNEPKLLNSTFTKYKFIYDTVSKEIRMEDIILEKGKVSTIINNYYMPTNTIDSKILFKFDLDYNEIYEWDKVLISTRDNELPIYNNDYLNYIRYGYKTERENLEASAAAQRQQAGTSAVLGIGGGTISGALLGAKIGSLAGLPGAAIGAVVGLGASIAAASASINTTNTNIANAERAMSQKLTELQNTASNVKSGGSSVDLMTYYTGNRLHQMTFEMPDLLKESLYDKLFYCGYSHPVQDKPKLDNRAIFNFLQCLPVFKNESTNRYNYYMADIKDRFNTGITKYHNISKELYDNADYDQLYTDWDQKYENWYFDRTPEVIVKQELVNLTDNNSEYANRFTLTVQAYVDESFYKPQGNEWFNSFKGYLYKADTKEDYLNNNWVLYTRTRINLKAYFENGALDTLTEDFEDIPYALRVSIKNDNLSFEYNKNIILDVPKKMTLNTPVISGSRSSFRLSSDYQINNTSKYKYQLAVNYNSAWNKYPYYEDVDFANNYTTNNIFQLDTDCNKHGLDADKVYRVYARVINLETGEYSQWAISELIGGLNG